MATTTPAELCYVYCVTEEPAPPLPATGMPEGTPPRAIPLNTGSAIVSTVPAHTYASSVLETRLGDLDWVGAAGAAHHAVIEAVADAGAVVVPFRLFTLFSSEAAALSGLDAARDALTRAFARVRGRQEWVLRIARPDPSRPVADAAPATASATSGTSFLQAKAEARRAASARAQRIKEDVAAAYEGLEQLADEARMRPVDGGGTLLLDAAFLVPPDRVDAMRETLTRRADRLLRDGCSVSLTGPWPPYSFASMDAKA